MSTNRLFQPLKLGNLDLKHRMILAPLTRFRATEDFIPGPHAKQYYEQRASEPGTLLISEATPISLRAGGLPHVPGIWNDEQIKAWREIVEAVHAKGCFIFLQLWALGRVAGEGQFSELLSKIGYPIVSSSPTPISNQGKVPKALDEDEIKTWVQDYGTATRNALAAGFDGVEIHGR